MDLGRLLNPASIAVVGATPRTETYAHETLRNLETLGYQGAVWGVHPRHREVRGRPVVPSLAELPAPADAIVVAVPAAAVPDVIEQAGATGCGGAVVIAAGFAEAGQVELEDALAAAARRHDLPVIGPNCDGIVRLHRRVALWGDSLRAQEAGPVALISQSGNLAVNALAARRGLRLHTVVSCGNQAVLDAGDLLTALVEDDGVRSIALYLEDDGDGPRLCEALARCAERDIGVAVLKAGASAAGAGAAATHTGALAGDHRVFRALVEEAGGAWARDAHELLELAKALAGGVRARGRGVALVTCSGADSAVGADEAERQGVALPPLQPDTARCLRAVLPAAATVANPLDYTALVWGDVEVLRDAIAAVGSDPAIDQVLVFFDKPPDPGGWAARTWDDALEGIVQGAAASAAPLLMASTLPELLGDADAADLMARGIPALQGLREGLRCALALQPGAPGAAGRLRAIAGAARGSAVDRARGAGPDRGPGAAGGRWLAEHEAKALLRAAGVPVVDGRAVADEDDAVRAAAELGWPVAVKRSSPAIRHKTEAGALALDVADEPTLRAEYRRLVAIDGHGTSLAVLVERMADGAVELLVAARRDAVVPALVIALGGTWTELLDDVAVVPLPAGPGRVATAIRSLRGAPLLAGARGRPPLDVDAAASIGAAAGRTLLDAGLELLELNPVLVGRRGAVVVDAVARARGPAAERALA
jgi:acyl-CoA synthetase (NDP forming)